MLTIVISAISARQDRLSRSKDRAALLEQQNEAALTTATAIIDVVKARIDTVVGVEMAKDNKMPLGGEASLSGFSLRLLQQDIATAFGTRYETITAAALEMETWSHALQQFRERAFAVQQRALEEAKDDKKVYKFVEAGTA